MKIVWNRAMRFGGAAAEASVRKKRRKSGCALKIIQFPYMLIILIEKPAFFVEPTLTVSLAFTPIMH